MDLEKKLDFYMPESKRKNGENEKRRKNFKKEEQDN